MLDNKDLAIILALIEKPMATDPQLMELINNNPSTNFNISVPTINRRIKSLFERQIIHGAVPEISFTKLDMTLHTFLLRVNPHDWKKNTSLLKKFFDAHPYTNYQNRTFGAVNGIFCQFNLPNQGNALSQLLEVFDLFRKDEIIDEYEHFTDIERSVGYNANLENWDAASNKWSVDFDAIEDGFQTNVQVQSRQSRDEQSILDQVQLFDMIILREMTRNARRSQTEMLDFAMNHEPLHLYDDYFGNPDNPSSKQTFSRRYNFLIENGIVSHFELAYDRMQFGEFNQALYIGDYHPEPINQLIHLIEQDHIPFPCRLFFSEDKFIFWVNLPPAEIIHFPDIMMNHFDNLRVLFFGRYPDKYYFYHANFIEETKSWDTTREWMVEDPLRAIGYSLEDVD